MKLSLQAAPWLKTTLSYQWLENNYHTATDPVNDPLSGQCRRDFTGWQFARRQVSSPDRRPQCHPDSLAPTVPLHHFCLSECAHGHGANDSPSVAPYQGNIYSVIASATYVLNQKTDLTASYSLSVPISARTTPPMVCRWESSINSMPCKSASSDKSARAKFSLYYSFYHYDEPSSGGFNNFNAQAIFAMLSFQIP